MGTSGECPRCIELERRLAFQETLHTEALDALHREIAAMRGELAKHCDALAKQRGEIRDLRGRLKLDSRNSSKPPSSDLPGAGEKPRPNRKGRRPGGQPGHEGTTRRSFAPHEVDHHEEHHPTACQVCGGRVKTDPTLDPARHQVVDLPPTAAEVTEHVLYRGVCSCCKVTSTAPLPAGVPSGAVGPRLQAVFALLVGRYRLSRREAREAAISLFGPRAEVALGTVSTMEARASAALDPAYREAERAVRAASVIFADETSYARSGLMTWLWIACSRAVSYFRIDRRRSKEAFRRLLPQVDGVLTTDRWASYHEHPPERRQLCWAHLKRNFQELVDRGGAAAPVGHAGLRACADVFAACRDHRDGRLRFASLAGRLAPSREALSASLRRFRNCPDRKARALCRDLLKHFVSLWTFTRRPGVDPTNNFAERELRPAVLWRKGSFGCQSVRGELFVACMLTVARTLRRQGRNVLDFLEASIRAALCGSEPPSLLMG